MAEKKGRTWIAIESFSCQIADEDGEVHSYDAFKNVTRVREGHPLLAANPQFFRPVDDHVHYDIESAGGPEPEPKREAQILEDTPEATAKALERAAEAGIDVSTIAGSGVGGRVTKADVEAAIAGQA